MNPAPPTTSIEKTTRKSRPKWSFGVLNDKLTDEVPGSVLLLSGPEKINSPLGIENFPARLSTSSFPQQFADDGETRAESRGESREHRKRPTLSRRATSRASIPIRKKRTPDGKIVLDPQPEDSHNDPLNWPFWRRNAALWSLGFYCMIGGGITPILAAGFQDVANTYNVSVAQVALTTGLYMLGLGVGGVLVSPTAILFGKRPVYLATAVLFILTSVWCALSPNYPSLVAARVLQGVAVSPVEVLPSATVAEIFFLHERAFRLGIYTLLLLSGKNLVPLVAAVIINAASWRWVFWTVSFVVALGLALIFFFLPETYWDRTPRPKAVTGGAENFRRPLVRLASSLFSPTSEHRASRASYGDLEKPRLDHRSSHAEPSRPDQSHLAPPSATDPVSPALAPSPSADLKSPTFPTSPTSDLKSPASPSSPSDLKSPASLAPPSDLRSPTTDLEAGRSVHFTGAATDGAADSDTRRNYTEHWREQPRKTYLHSLRPYSGRISYDSWFVVAFRPFILFAYPSVLWSALVYSLSVGWLIVLSEAVGEVYRSRDTYNFTSFQAGLVYLSPFVGSILGTAVAGKVSDFIVRFMARRNGGVYEPEFRLVMAIPIAIATAMGLMGFGWSAEERDAWIVPTVFFGVVSFGCSLGSTTSITFCVDSYRQYAGEALVTLNFSKNIFHGLVFSLFFPHWLETSGSKKVFLILGGIQLICMFFSIPMFIYGKRARMWTVRKDFIGRF